MPSFSFRSRNPKCDKDNTWRVWEKCFIFIACSWGGGGGSEIIPLACRKFISNTATSHPCSEFQLLKCMIGQILWKRNLWNHHPCIACFMLIIQILYLFCFFFHLKSIYFVKNCYAIGIKCDILLLIYIFMTVFC